MKTYLALLTVTCLLGPAQGQETKPEGKLEGVWAITKLSVRGNETRPLPEDGVVEFSKGMMRMRMMETEIKIGKYTIDPSKKPAEMNIVRQEGDQKGMTVKAIFLLDGDDLKICLAEAPAVARPMRFKVEGGERLVYMELKRKTK